MTHASANSFDCYATLEANGKTYGYYNLQSDQVAGLADISQLPNSIKVLLENLLRHEDGAACTAEDIEAVAKSARQKMLQEIAYHPARVLMQDFTGVPAVVDLAAMRDALVKANVDPEKINPLSPVDLVIDHSVVIDQFATHTAFSANVEFEMQRNAERYAFLKWGQGAFDNFRLVPPGTGICHQVNLEYLAKCVCSDDSGGERMAYPDTLVGTDSHTTMINGLGVLGWGVGGIEAEAAMLGQPIPMLIPEVVGCELSGRLSEGITATDLVLRIVQMLRQHGVVGKFVEFYGSALDGLPLADRATIANMAPEYGATCGFFSIDQKTMDYLRLSGRDEDTVALVEVYSKAQGMWRDSATPDPVFASTLHLDISSVRANLSGPKRPQDRVALPDMPAAIEAFIKQDGKQDEMDKSFPTAAGYDLHHGDVVVAAITSCTNTSNPAVMIGAGLVAKKAVKLGMTRKPWVKSSLAPGSKVVTEYLEKAGLQKYLDALGFNTVGYGCTTCIGNSGPLPEAVHNAVSDHDLVATSVLSGNRNFEGRIHPLVKANWLSSPPLVVAYALAGSTRVNVANDAIGQDRDGNDVLLKDIWPSNDEIADEVAKIDQSMFTRKYADVFTDDDQWQAVPTTEGNTYSFSADSTYIQLPPFFEEQYTSGRNKNIEGARVLVLLGDSVTTDHISPAGSIAADSPAAKYLIAHGVTPKDFNSYGSRRGNHEVMMRGTFGNIRIKNELVPGVEGGYTRAHDDPTVVAIYDAAMSYRAAGIPTVVVAGKEYGAGSSRDWAAKGPLLLGVRTVIVESFERIHRSNLVGMGVLPLQFMPDEDRKTLNIAVSDSIDILGLDKKLTPKQVFEARINRADGSVDNLQLQSRIDTAVEVEYFLCGGVLPFVLKRLKG
ncbi:aconitate hydratase AcnA [Candidatus Spongiihabitans sp.]|uniref:aconitate hydratase AcnA n=1 Tax=Candidatus Spongiihabitans sp. TaxID=3101308 RepID=UPI003C7D972B